MVAHVCGPVIVDSGVLREERDVHRVVGMMVAEDDVGDLLGVHAEGRACAGLGQQSSPVTGLASDVEEVSAMKMLRP